MSMKVPEFYLDNGANFEEEMQRCEQIFQRNESKEVLIHGFGDVINKAMNIALILQRKFSLEMAINTSTVELVNDVQKPTSAIHIKLFKH